MSLSLKSINKPLLTLVVVANVVVYYVILTFGFDLQNMTSLFAEYESFVPSALVALIVGILNAQLDHTWKARLVFWKWRNPLPGSRAFSKIMYSDPRIDPEALRTHVDPLPDRHVDQNRLWFKWYQEYKNEAAVEQVHREYLFTRDWTGLVALFVISLGPLALWQMDSKTAGIFVLLLALQYLLVRRAAKNHGERFVASVLAVKSTQRRT